MSALGLLSQASNGTTFEEIKNGLNLVGNKLVLADHFHNYLGQLRQGVGKTTLGIFNQIYVQQCYEIGKDFRDVAEKKFFSVIESVKFEESVETAQFINQFVEKNTNNKIKNVIEPDSLSPDTPAILINVISFRGIWENEFDKKETYKGDFYNTKSETVPVNYMSQDYFFENAVFEDLDATAVQMRYVNSNFSFIIVLPRSIEGLSALETKLNNFNLTKIADKMKRKWVELSIPKFRIEFDINLNDVLNSVRMLHILFMGKEKCFLMFLYFLNKYGMFQMGMREMFTPKADFSGLLESKETSNPLYISNVIHKTFIDVNEAGTDAYSATGKSAFNKRSDQSLIIL